jgi:hypothetical protein
MALAFAATAGTLGFAALDTRQRRRESLSLPAQETPVREGTQGAWRGGVDNTASVTPSARIAATTAAGIAA